MAEGPRTASSALYSTDWGSSLLACVSSALCAAFRVSVWLWPRMVLQAREGVVSLWGKCTVMIWCWS